MTESKFRLLHYMEFQKSLYAAQQLRGLDGTWWASYTAALCVDHHIPWGEFRTIFHAHYLFVGLLHNKLKEFLDLEQWNHTMFNYTRQFNTMAHYGSYHVDTDEKKAGLFREGLTIQLQGCLVQSPNLSYNDMVSAAIDQERTMKAIVEAEERKMIMSGSSKSGGSGGAPPKYHMVYSPPSKQLHRPPQYYWGNCLQYQ
jgi:hypothetical protein